MRPDITFKNHLGEDVPFASYKGQVLLIVNVASKCGFTPQYEDLEKLYQKYKDQGFTILGFPCNQFGKQERGTDAQIQEFCHLNYQVTFPVFQKIEVNGPGTHPIYEYLKSKAPGLLGSSAIKWNFTKFLLSRDGGFVIRYAPMTKPFELEGKIQKFLGQ